VGPANRPPPRPAVHPARPGPAAEDRTEMSDVPFIFLGPASTEAAPAVTPSGSGEPPAASTCCSRCATRAGRGRAHRNE
jgi:hypothetical protein